MPSPQQQATPRLTPRAQAMHDFKRMVRWIAAAAVLMVIGALAIVLLAHQATDAARFLVFAIAVATHAPLPVGIGGAAAGAAIVFAGWLAPELVLDPRLRSLRRGLGALLLAAGAFLCLRAMGRI